MADITHLLESLVKKMHEQSVKPIFVLGKNWLKHSKKHMKALVVAARLTRTAVAKAQQQEAKLIVTIFPPTFHLNSMITLPEEQQELLEILFEQKIAVFSLTEDWLTTIQGGFDYLLELLDFQYSSLYKLSKNKQTPTGKSLGRLGEREDAIKFKDLITLLTKTVAEPVRYCGFHDTPIKKILICKGLYKEESIYAYVKQKGFDALLVGELTQKAKQAINLTKIPTVLLGSTNLENLLLGKVRRTLMEYITVDLPELITVKENPFGHSSQK